MQSKQVQFVGANIEVGQTHKGLSQSAAQFLSYLCKSKKSVSFDINSELSVTAEVRHKSPRSFRKQDLNQIDFSAYKKLAEINDKILQKRNIALNFGGDHSIAVATVEASLRSNPKTHIIWIDAHADANSAEQSFTGSFHGMPVYYLMMNRKNRPACMDWMRSSLHPAQITYVGLRDIDPFEIKLLNDLQIDYFTSDFIRTNGLKKVIDRIQFKNKLFDNIHLSFDIDSLDPKYGLCTGVPALGGLEIDDVFHIFETVRESNKLTNFDFVEVNPKLANSQAELDQIYGLAVQLIQAAVPAKSQPSPTHFKEEIYANLSY
ncbi:MAG: arginase family protein [Bdellovibrio sp.]|nr:arginase family protein [Bdellovibrio sp.]